MQPCYDRRVKVCGMKCALSVFLCVVPLMVYAGAPAATQPAVISLHLQSASAPDLLAQLAKQSGAILPLFPPDLLKKTAVPHVTMDLDRLPFWIALEQISRKTGLEPVFSPEDPYPRFQLGLGGGTFWEGPHIVVGPVVLFANEVERTNSVELGKEKHQFERELTVNLTAFVEPGLRVLYASPRISQVLATDEHAKPLKPGDDNIDNADANDAANGVFKWNLAVTLNGPSDSATRKIARLRGRTRLRVQTAEQRMEIDDVMKVRGIVRTVAGAPFTFRSLKKADIEYILQLNLRREKLSTSQWRDLHYSIYNGQMALYDEQGRLVAARGSENGGDYTDTKIDATLRFVREPGISDPKAGDPFKLVWLAPTAATDIPIDFEFTNLPIPE
jgi:hypothetical protein